MLTEVYGYKCISAWQEKLCDDQHDLPIHVKSWWEYFLNVQMNCLKWLCMIAEMASNK